MPMTFPPHPGRSILRDCMEPLGMTLDETASKLEISPEELQRVINGESGITFPMSVRLDKLFGCGASTWYQLQAAYDRAQEDNKGAVPEEPELSEIQQQTATVPLEHGRLVFKTYDAQVISLRVVRPNVSTPSSISSDDRVEPLFVGEGPGAVQIQLIYQPSPTAAPRLVADTLFKAYLEWDETAEEYIGHVNASEWNTEIQKLYEGKDTMNALNAGLGQQAASPTLYLEKSIESGPEQYAEVLKEAEELLHKGTDSVSAEALAGV